VILFHSLSRQQLAKIVDVQLNYLRKRLAGRGLLCQLQPDLGEPPHARQQGSAQGREVGGCRGPDQKVGIGLRGGGHRLRFQLGAVDPQLGGEAAVEWTSR